MLLALLPRCNSILKCTVPLWLFQLEENFVYESYCTSDDWIEDVQFHLFLHHFSNWWFHPLSFPTFAESPCHQGESSSKSSPKQKNDSPLLCPQLLFAYSFVPIGANFAADGLCWCDGATTPVVMCNQLAVAWPGLLRVWVSYQLASFLSPPTWFCLVFKDEACDTKQRPCFS